MDKNSINTFIQKYSLGGLVESVMWKVEGDVLSTSFISDDKTVIGNITWSEFEHDDIELGIYDTTKLVKMLSVLNTDIEFGVKKSNGQVIALALEDSHSSVNYILADPRVIPTAPTTRKLPEFNIAIKLDDAFTNRFIKSKNALPEETNFSFVPLAENRGQIVIGHSSTNTNRISIDVDCECPADISAISFSAVYLKEILVANKDATSAHLAISTSGLASVKFTSGAYTSDYYLVVVVA